MIPRWLTDAEGTEVTMTHEWHLQEENERLASACELHLAMIEELRRRLLEAKGLVTPVMQLPALQAHWEGKPGEPPRIKDGCGCGWCAGERAKLTALGHYGQPPGVREPYFPAAVLAVDTPASRGEIPVPPGEDPVELVIDQVRRTLAEPLGLDAAQLIARYPDHPAGTCKDCRTGPLYKGNECWYCNALHDMTQIAPAPARQREPLSITSTATMLAAGLALIALSVHLALWLAACGLALIISAFILGRRS